MRKITFLIFSITAFHITYAFPLISQDSITQRYYYSDNKIELQLSSDKAELTPQDTLNLDVSLKNLSSDSMFFIKEYYVKLNEQEKRENEIVYIGFGSLRSSGIEMPYELLCLKKDSSYSFKVSISGNDLVKHNINNYFNIILGFDYIPSMSMIRKYENKKWIETKWLSTDTIEISSLIFDLALKGECYLILGMKLMNKE